LKPLSEALKALIPEKKEEGDKGQAEKKDEKVDPNDVETLTKTIKRLQEEIEKYKEEKGGKSTSLKGQDDAGDKKDYTYKDQMDELERDGFGRRVKKKEEKKK
jgi:predicted RNase H-like nuclease (RuvC/YqgF family)